MIIGDEEKDFRLPKAPISPRCAICSKSFPLDLKLKEIGACSRCVRLIVGWVNKFKISLFRQL